MGSDALCFISNKLTLNKLSDSVCGNACQNQVKKRTQYHDITEYRGIGDCFYSPPTSFSSSSMALSSCWSLPLSITPGIFLTLIIGSVWLFSIHSPDIFLALTGTTPQRVPSGNPSHPAQLQVPGTGIPTVVPMF